MLLIMIRQSLLYQFSLREKWKRIWQVFAIKVVYIRSDNIA